MTALPQAPRIEATGRHGTRDPPRCSLAGLRRRDGQCCSSAYRRPGPCWRRGSRWKPPTSWSPSCSSSPFPSPSSSESSPSRSSWLCTLASPVYSRSNSSAARSGSAGRLSIGLFTAVVVATLVPLQIWSFVSGSMPGSAAKALPVVVLCLVVLFLYRQSLKQLGGRRAVLVGVVAVALGAAVSIV